MPIGELTSSAKDKELKMSSERPLWRELQSWLPGSPRVVMILEEFFQLVDILIRELMIFDDQL